MRLLEWDREYTAPVGWKYFITKNNESKDYWDKYLAILRNVNTEDDVVVEYSYAFSNLENNDSIQSAMAAVYKIYLKEERNIQLQEHEELEL